MNHTHGPWIGNPMTALEIQLYNALRALWDGKTYGKWSEEFDETVKAALTAFEES